MVFGDDIINTNENDISLASNISTRSNLGYFVLQCTLPNQNIK
jgi:hypothetical protein